MNPSIARPPRFALGGRDGARVSLTSDQGYCVEIFVLEPDVIRVLHAPPGGLAGPRTWAIAPGLEDARDEGRDRRDLSGFSQPDFTLEETEGHLTIATDRLRVTIRLAGLFFRWEMAGPAGWALIARDRPTQPTTSVGGAAASATIWSAIQPSAISAWANGPANWTAPAAASG